jgi:hypothetical protein
VERLQTTAEALLKLVTLLAVTALAILSGVELWLRGELRHMGVPQTVQTPILLLVAALLILGSLRLFGGLIRIAAVLVLVLIAIHIVMPVVQG